MNLDVIKLKQDVQTRWNSSFYMLRRLLRTKVPLSATLPLLTSPPPSLNAEEWLIIEDCVALLEPMEKVMSVLSGESYPDYKIRFTISLQKPKLEDMYSDRCWKSLIED